MTVAPYRSSVSISENGVSEPTADAPLVTALRVVAGEPSAEELAALVAVLSAVSQPPAVVEEPEDARVDRWAAPWRGIGAQVPLGPGAWSAESVG